MLFTAGQNLLQSHERDISEGNRGVDEFVANGNGTAVVGVNRFKLNVLTNAVCVDILVWAARDEQGRILLGHERGMNHAQAPLHSHLVRILTCQ